MGTSNSANKIQENNNINKFKGQSKENQQLKNLENSSNKNSSNNSSKKNSKQNIYIYISIPLYKIFLKRKQ